VLDGHLQVVVIATPSAGKSIPAFQELLPQRASLHQKPKPNSLTL
jgi:hypothetical protein